MTGLVLPARSEMAESATRIGSLGRIRAGLGADVFVPASSTPMKLKRIEGYGAVLHRVDGHVGDALDACLEFSTLHGW